MTAVDDSGDLRVLRGGSWDVNQYVARAVYRNYDHPSDSRRQRTVFGWCVPFLARCF